MENYPRILGKIPGTKPFLPNPRIGVSILISKSTYSLLRLNFFITNCFKCNI